MKAASHTTLLLIATLMLLAATTGCRSILVQIPVGSAPKTPLATARVFSFGNKTTVGSMSYNPTNGTFTLRDYNNDQVQGIQAIAAGVAAGIQAAGAAKP